MFKGSIRTLRLRYGKEIKLFGKTTSLKFQRLKILIIGLDGLGLEISRHIITQNPDQLGLCD